MAGADAHNGQPPARTPAQLGHRRLRFGNGTGGIRRLSLGVTEAAVGSNLSQRRRFRHAMCAHFGKDHLGGVGEARRLGLEFGGLEKPQRHAEIAGERENCGLVGFQGNGIY